VGESALLGRVTADEFALLRPGMDSPEGLALAEQIRAALVLDGWLVDGVRHPLAISGGVASLGADDSGFKDLFRRAETALSQARLSGMAPA